MKRNILISLLLIMAITLTLSACGPSSTTSQTEDNSLQKVMDKGELVLGLDDAFPPMGFKDENGEIVGFDIDLAKEVTKRLGVKLTLQPIDWKANIMELDSGNVDVLWNGFSVTEERKQAVTFSDPYLSNAQIIIVPVNSDIKTKADLAGKKVGIQKGSSAVDALQADKDTYNAIGTSNIYEYPDNTAAMMDLDIGRVQAVIVDSVVGKYYMTKNQGKYEILEEDFGKEDYAVGFRKNDKALAEKINSILKEMKDDGTYKTIYDKWFAE